MMYSTMGSVAIGLARFVEAKPERPLVYVAATEQDAEALVRFLGEVAPRLDAVHVPPWDCLPYDRSDPSLDCMGRRMAALHRMAAGREGGRPLIVATTADAVLQRLPPPDAVVTLALAAGSATGPDALRDYLSAHGYVDDTRVDVPGEFAFHGEVADVYPAADPWPVRIEWQDGLIDAIRRYDPLTQLTVEDMPALSLAPACEWPTTADEEGRERAPARRLAAAYDRLATLFDHLPEALLVEAPASAERRRILRQQVAEAYEDRKAADAGSAGEHLPPPDRLYVGAAEWSALAADRAVALPDLGPIEPLPAIATAPRPQRAFAEALRRFDAEGTRIILIAATEGDAAILARRARSALGRAPERMLSLAAGLAAAERFAVLTAGLDRGFVAVDLNLALVTARDVLGSRAESGWTADRAGDRRAGEAWKVQGELQFDDIVVHEDHGVGALRGLERIQTPLGLAEALRLDYAKDAVLIEPIAGVAKLWRYGPDTGAVALDRLDGQAWPKRREKIEAAIEATAEAMVALAAERQRTRAPKLVPPARDYERFAERFPYTPTPDQERAIAAVLDDLASGRPMNRLVVGDVGFGKTEVALRAAAAAALAGRQVAVVAPTTVLARQHHGTFARRFSGLGIEVGHLSRLVPDAEARRTRERLADGSLRVVIGTHALAGDGVAFAELGLLVIDEEQRFGTAQKDRLRERAEVLHVLTMTATPIPRTLQSALIGLQDLSLIETPPARRRPIRTILEDFDETTLRAALLRERRRGGQSFVVVPRVEDIEATARLLGRVVPDLDLMVAHGRLPPREADAVLLDFSAGRGDVLLATSIIESGLDVPRANTMAVLRPDRFGLAELHQLRGRVGRGRAQAVCYLFTTPGEALPEATVRRLGTLQAFDRLGAGFTISAQDLDLRGAGDLMGEEQAGHVRLIGLGLYQNLLTAALRRARGEPADDRTTELNIEAGGAIPEDYVARPEIRLDLYERLARATDIAEIEQLESEIADRFGDPPLPVETLVTLAFLRVGGKALGLSRISAGPKGVAFEFHAGVERPDGAERQGFEPSGDRLVYRRESATIEDRLRIVREAVERLAG